MGAIAGTLENARNATQIETGEDTMTVVDSKTFWTSMFDADEAEGVASGLTAG